MWGSTRSMSKWLALIGCASILLTSRAPAEEPPKTRFDIASQDLATALNEYALQGNREILFSPEIVQSVRTAGVRGEYTVVAALGKLLEGTGLQFRLTDTDTILVERGAYADSRHTGNADSSRQPPAQAPTDPQKNLDQESETPEKPGPNEKRSGSSAIELGEIVVTGTHIRGVAPVGSPLIVIDRAQIQASGHGRVQDVLEALPQNFSGSASEDFQGDLGSENVTRGQAIDLRGLGSSSTLILVNGRRQPAGGTEGAFVDISSIAASAIERIEVLTDGASALYGSDAIGGVVNFVLRKDYEGVEVNVRLGTIEDGAAEELQASLLGGRSWTGGNLLLGYQYSHRDALMDADAFYASRGADFREFGGSDNRSPRSNPGTIIDPTTFEPAFAIPEGQDGTNLTEADLIPGQNFQDNVTGSAALPEQTLHSAFFTLSHDLSDRFEIFAEGRYSQRDMVLLFGGDTALLFVPPTNPFYVNPFGTTDPVIVAYDFKKDFGTSTFTSETETYTLAAGVIARLGQEWELNTAAAYGREKNPWEWFNNHNFFTIDAALADPDPTTAFNPFGDGSNTNPATIEPLRLTDLREGVSTVGSLTAIADGPIFRLPAGPARLAVGADYRDESVEAHFGFIGPATDLPRSPFSVGDLERQVAAVFGELVLPVLGNEEGASGTRRLELALAGRYEDYSDFGSAFNPKIGLNFMPTAGVKLRGSCGTSFRAPRFGELSLNRSFSGTLFAVPDPQSSTGLSDVLFMIGTNPDLQPETADTWTVGFDLTPARLPELAVSATYFSLDYEDKIEAGGEFADTLVFEDQWAEIITRNPTQEEIDAVCSRPDFSGDCPSTVAAIIDIRLRNLALVRVHGVDFDLGYRKSLNNLGDLNLGLTGTYMLTHDQAISSTSPHIDVLDTAFNPLALRLRGRAGWAFNRWRVNAFVNYTDDYREFEDGPKIDSWTTIDSSIGYQFDAGGWMSGADVQFSVVNLLDEEPPFVNGFSGFDGANASEVGRSMSLAITKRWGSR